MLLSSSDVYCVGDARGGGGTRAAAESSLASPTYKHLSLHNIWCYFTKVGEGQG